MEKHWNVEDDKVHEASSREILLRLLDELQYFKKPIDTINLS